MVVVGDHVAVHAALLAQHGRQALVPRLHRAPRRLQEVDPPGEHLAARRHAWQGAGEVVVEHRAALRQPVDVGRDGELVAVAAQVVAVQGVHDDEDGSHGCGPRVAVSVVRRIMPYPPSSHGLVTSTSRPSKSVTFRVASAKSCAFAVPAISVGARTDCARVEHRREQADENEIDPGRGDAHFDVWNRPGGNLDGPEVGLCRCRHEARRLCVLIGVGLPLQILDRHMSKAGSCSFAEPLIPAPFAGACISPGEAPPWLTCLRRGCPACQEPDQLRQMRLHRSNDRTWRTGRRHGDPAPACP